jgi:dCTP deaminase
MSVLTGEELLRLLASTDPNERLVVTPLLDPDAQVRGGAIDLRLGTKFILFRQAEVSRLKSGREVEHRAASLHHARKDFAERFVLHPGQFALSDTIEFVGLPGNLCAYVTSRSRYGRAGLVIATAIYVHPYWKGFLTLELQNYGSLPVELECGTRIAQLVVHRADLSAPPTKFHTIPTGPSFPSLVEDDTPVLKAFRDYRGTPDSAD